jgi:hypothetical protein
VTLDPETFFCFSSDEKEKIRRVTQLTPRSQCLIIYSVAEVILLDRSLDNTVMHPMAAAAVYIGRWRSGSQKATLCRQIKLCTV